MSLAPGSAMVFARAAYACDPAKTRGRRHAEIESETRTVFQRDRDRIIHCAAFRRLKHKTQVFVYHEGDHYRTRLTHSLEVAQVARSLARTLRLDEDLSEALALAHDLGHPPFGHAGEQALQVAMAPYGGFDHNGQTLRVLTELEARYADFDGLNLTWETLEGVAKHNGPLRRVGDDDGPLQWAVDRYNKEHDLGLSTWPSAEAQVASLSDDIAYNAHDIDDGLRAELFGPADLVDVPLVGPIVAGVDAAYPGLERSRLVHETVRRLINEMIADVVAESRRRLATAAPESADDIRALDYPVIAFSGPLAEANRHLKTFLFERMYRHSKVNRMTSKARRVVADLFGIFLAEPECLPTEWRRRAEETTSETTRARVVADYIAGMTDRFAQHEHRRLFDLYDER
jgi:dGTPase